MWSIVIALALFGALVGGTPHRNTTIPHSPNETCKDTNWYDIAVFFIGNYVAHAATVKSYPGEATSRALVATMGALLIPTSGLVRGLNSILRNAKFKQRGIIQALHQDPDYDTAAASGSLCMVVRKKSWKPYPGDKVSDVILREESREVPVHGKWALKKRSWARKSTSKYFYDLEPIPSDDDKSTQNPARVLKVYRGPWSEERAKLWGFTDTADEFVSPQKIIHGFYDFKDQGWSYALAHVPRDAVIAVRRDPEVVTPRRLESATTHSSLATQSTACERTATGTCGENEHEVPLPVIAASYSLPKAMIAVVQLGFAVSTLYQSSGSQLNYYGYAAFGITVVPYALMSFVNLLGNMLTPDYHALYLVGSDIMDEAIRRGARFDGVVGKLVQDTTSSTAVAEVLSQNKDNEEKDAVQFSYQDETSCREFPATIVDYSTSSSLPMRKRRELITELLETTYRDLSPSLFIPSCSKFLRQKPYVYPTDVNRTQMTFQGSFSLSSMQFTAWRTIICFINAAVVFSIIAALTRFKSGNTTNAQTNWILHWYIFGTVYSGFGIEDGIMNVRSPEYDQGPPSKYWGLLVAVPLLLYGIPALGGFVVVSQMLYQYGTCSLD